MENKEPTQETHPDAESTPAAGGDEAVETQTGLSLEDINAITGRDYKDLDTAKESLVEMQKMASKAAQKPEPVEKAPDESRAEYEERLANLEAENFYARNQDHEQNRSLIENLAKGSGKSRAEVLASEEYKSIFEAQQSVAKNQTKRTVADSNNRVNQPAQDEDLSSVLGNKHKSAEYVANKFFKKD